MKSGFERETDNSTLGNSKPDFKRETENQIEKKVKKSSLKKKIRISKWNPKPGFDIETEKTNFVVTVFVLKKSILFIHSTHLHLQYSCVFFVQYLKEVEDRSVIHDTDCISYQHIFHSIVNFIYSQGNDVICVWEVEDYEY